MSWQTFLYIGFGGFLGANARYSFSLLLGSRFSGWAGSGISFGTLFVNVTGSFLLALFLFWAQRRIGQVPDNVKLLIGTGFFGAYTTFSTYATESVSLLQTGWRSGVLYIVLTNVLCLFGVIIGLWLGSRIWAV